MASSINVSTLQPVNSYEAAKSSLPSFPTPPQKNNYDNQTTDTKFTSSTTPLATETSAPGLLSEDVYNATLPWWRAVVRARLVRSLGWQSPVLAKMQVGNRYYLDAIAE